MATTPTEHRAKIAEARNVLGEVISRARYAGEPTVLVNRGKEAAVIVSYDFYEQARHDRAKLDAVQAYLDELGTDATRGDVMNIRRVVFETLEIADRRAAENIARASD
ncbi:type II toxin-antitoxin system prevent-host-death family antitoxin [Streptomyces sp. NBC_00433]